MALTGAPMQLIQDEYYAAVDLGSNSFHMVIVRIIAGSIQIVSKNKHKVRLAAGLDSTNKLSDESLQRALDCITNFAEKLQDIPNSNIRIVATATLRLATNAVDFIQPAEHILNNKINIISGNEEARQIFLGVAYTSANQGNTLVVDIGGASTEVIVGRDLQPVYLHSFDMGCVTYMEKFFTDGVLNKDNFDNAISAATEQLTAYKNIFLCFDWTQCLGASGTPQAVTSILVKRNISDAIKLEFLYQLKDECMQLGHAHQLYRIEELERSRQAIFPSGLAILIAVFETLKINNMQLSGGALREGIIYGMLEEFKKSDRKMQGINQLISRFRIDKLQSDRAMKTAQQLCEQMNRQVSAHDIDTEIIVVAAAALHEIGLHIGYKHYHQHGAYILDNTDINGYTLLQKMMIKDLVLLHRGEIDKTLLDGYKSEVRLMLFNALRLVRISIILVTRRNDNALPLPELCIDGDKWNLIFDKKIRNRHPLIMTELDYEAWLQHSAGWPLQINTG